MFDFLWGILNLILVLSFFFFLIGLVVRGKKFLDPYPKVFTGPVLFFGVLGLLNSTSSSQKPISSYKGFATSQVIDVAEYLSNKIQLVLVRDSESKEIFHEGSYSSIHGFVMGLEWQHVGLVEKDKRLEVHGFYRYSFMGLNVFNSVETYVIDDINPDLN